MNDARPISGDQTRACRTILVALIQSTNQEPMVSFLKSDCRTKA